MKMDQVIDSDFDTMRDHVSKMINTLYAYFFFIADSIYKLLFFCFAFYLIETYCLKIILSSPNRIGFPSILKLEHGSSGVGVYLLNSETELENKTAQILETLRAEDDFPGIGLGFDNSMVLTEFHEGSEHDVDVIIFNRKLVAAFISDNGLTNRPYFTGNCFSFVLFSTGLGTAKNQLISTVLAKTGLIKQQQQKPSV